MNNGFSQFSEKFSEFADFICELDFGSCLCIEVLYKDYKGFDGVLCEVFVVLF